MKLYHFINSEYGLDAIRDQKFKISTYDELNDPFELFATALDDVDIRRAFGRFKNDMTIQVGLLCCSKSWKSTLLWSHYADKHKGVALVLEVDEKLITHIEYSKKRIEINQTVMNELTPNPSGKGLGGRVMKTKSWDWAYEKEARIQFQIGDMDTTNRPLFAPFGDGVKIVGLILGPLCTLTLSEIEECLPKNIELIVKKARIAFKSFTIVPRKDFKPVRLHGRV